MDKAIITLTYFRNDVYKKTLYLEIHAGWTINDVMSEVGLTSDALYIFLVNKKLKKVDTILKHGDVVRIMPALAGG